MTRLAAIAAALIASAWTSAAAVASPAPTAFLTWPGKTGGPAPAATAAPPASVAPAGGVTLTKQFFGAGGDDMAAPPPPLMPRPVPGSQTVTSTATANTASNRARQIDILTADSASDGPVAGAENPN